MFLKKPPPPPPAPDPDPLGPLGNILAACSIALTPLARRASLRTAFNAKPPTNIPANIFQLSVIKLNIFVIFSLFSSFDNHLNAALARKPVAIAPKN